MVNVTYLYNIYLNDLRHGSFFFLKFEMKIIVVRVTF